MKNIIQVPEKNILRYDHDILQIIQAGLPILAFLLNQSQNENKIRTFDTLTDIA
jgi:hypothetical protein